MANEQRIASHTSHVCMGWSTLFPIKPCVTEIGLQDDMTFIGSAVRLSQLLDESAQAAPLQLRSVGSRLFTTRGPITTKVLRKLCVKIQRERDGLELLGSAANKQFATLVQTGGKTAAHCKKKKPRQGCQSFANDASNRPSAVWRATRTTM